MLIKIKPRPYTLDCVLSDSQGCQVGDCILLDALDPEATIALYGVEREDLTDWDKQYFEAQNGRL